MVLPGKLGNWQKLGSPGSTDAGGNACCRDPGRGSLSKAGRARRMESLMTSSVPPPPVLGGFEFRGFDGGREEEEEEEWPRGEGIDR